MKLYKYQILYNAKYNIYKVQYKETFIHFLSKIGWLSLLLYAMPIFGWILLCIALYFEWTWKDLETFTCPLLAGKCIQTHKEKHNKLDKWVKYVDNIK